MDRVFQLCQKVLGGVAALALLMAVLSAPIGEVRAENLVEIPVPACYPPLCTCGGLLPARNGNCVATICDVRFLPWTTIDFCAMCSKCPAISIAPLLCQCYVPLGNEQLTSHVVQMMFFHSISDIAEIVYFRLTHPHH